jgi:hypothetical protein
VYTIKFIIWLFKKYVVEYEKFKELEEYRAVAKEYVNEKYAKSHRSYENMCEIYGVAKFPTLAEITEQNDAYIKSNPELFPEHILIKQ